MLYHILDYNYDTKEVKAIAASELNKSGDNRSVILLCENGVIPKIGQVYSVMPEYSINPFAGSNENYIVHGRMQ